jgi:uncharacterized protein (DUF924 family)
MVPKTPPPQDALLSSNDMTAVMESDNFTRFLFSHSDMLEQQEDVVAVNMTTWIGGSSSKYSMGFDLHCPIF